MSLVSDMTETSPLVLVVDDAQWCDTASVQALTFMLRRTRRLPLLTVFLQRPGADILEPIHRLVRDRDGVAVPLDGLDVGELRELVAARTDERLSQLAAQRLHAHTGGNPLEIVTLIVELDPDLLAMGIGDLPAPKSYATLVLNRLAACPPAVEHLVAAVAVLGAPTPLAVLDRMIGDDDFAGLIDECLSQGLISIEKRGGVRTVDVDHPLLRSALLGDLEPGRLARLHRQAAEVIDDPGRAMLHRLRGVLGEDPQLASEAVSMAKSILADGWEMSAVELLSCAADVAGPGRERSNALILAADRLLAVGDRTTAVQLLGGVDDQHSCVQFDLVRGHLAFLDGDPRVARVFLRRAWTNAGDDHLTASRAAALIATTYANAGWTDKTLTWARRALEREAEAPPEANHALSMIASAWALKGDELAGLKELEQWQTKKRERATGCDGVLARGLLCLWTGDMSTAVMSFESILARDIESVDPLTRATALYSLADACYRQGDWDRALNLAESLAKDLRDTDRILSLPMAGGMAAMVLGGRGDYLRAEERLKVGHEALAQSGNPAGSLWLIVASARGSFAKGEWLDVVLTLEPLAEILRGVGLSESVQPWRADLVESLVNLGRLGEATDALSELEERIGTGAHAMAGVHRCRAVLAAALGDDDAAAAEFEAGLALDIEAVGGFERGRLELSAGAFNRRSGRRRLAADQLDSARSRFEVLGAGPYPKQARRERDACGLARRSDEMAHTSLTPAERRRARLLQRRR